MNTLTQRNFAAIKRVAMNVNPLVVKKNKLQDKIEDMLKEINDLETEISGHEMGIKALTGGFSTEDLVSKVVETTDKLDAKGQPVKVTKYVPSPMLEFHDEDKMYHIILPVENTEITEENIDVNAVVDMVELKSEGQE